ncbi:alpha/beta fold hydrolase [Pontibacter arcticus]|uniref:Alpha/beta hydrolase n=1 Tax=Pontibacter arcticus TaxID=2080288 RepID=A0A364RFE6_9BACT|nr:alpha/beta hydrolase [Pontibacter arcticus]RAU83019.1 alpha/beta hydrolase [Pontibacter arcticus]
MKALITSFFILLATMFANGQSIYTKTFGNSKSKPVIFLHGGPGYNSANFEATTAQKLADEGFYVIVYDRRGEGRSEAANAQFTFKETFDDLNAIYQKYGLKKSMLIGHSFGGVVATLFAEKHPEKIQSIILVGAPVSLQETFTTIIAKSKEIYQAKNDKVNLNYIAMLENMDRGSIEYSSYSFMHAMQNGFYTPKNPTEEAKAIYAKFKTDTLITKHASQMSYQAPQGFWKNEKYTTLDLTANLKNLKAKNIKVRGLYGKDDGLYAVSQVKALQSEIGESNVKYLDNCSHNVFIDQQSQFKEAIKTWSK